MLHCGNEFLKFKLDDIISRYGPTIKSFFLGTVGITFFGTWTLFKTGFIDCSKIPDGELFFFKISLKFSTSKWNKM